jgi:hypothetical protein
VPRPLQRLPTSLDLLSMHPRPPPHLKDRQDQRLPEIRGGLPYLERRPTTLGGRKDHHQRRLERKQAERQRTMWKNMRSSMRSTGSGISTRYLALTLVQMSKSAVGTLTEPKINRSSESTRTVNRTTLDAGTLAVVESVIPSTCRSDTVAGGIVPKPNETRPTRTASFLRTRPRLLHSKNSRSLTKRSPNLRHANFTICLVILTLAAFATKQQVRVSAYFCFFQGSARTWDF